MPSPTGADHLVIGIGVVTFGVAVAVGVEGEGFVGHGGFGDAEGGHGDGDELAVGIVSEVGTAIIDPARCVIFLADMQASQAVSEVI